MNRRECDGAIDRDPFLSKVLREGKPGRPRREVHPIRDAEVIDGGLPPICTGQVKQKDRWFTGYEETYVEKDIRNLANIADLVAFRRLFKLTANRTGQLLNISQLVKAATRWGSSDVAGLNAFLKAEPRCNAGFLAYNGTEIARLGDRLWAVPIDTLLS
jgi:hypothetical protein